MNRIVKSRTIRIPCSAVNPAAEPPALPALSPSTALRTNSAEGSAVEASAAEPSAAEGPVAQGSPAKGPAPRPNNLALPACTERSERALSRRDPAERPRRPHPARHARLCSVCNHPDRDAIEEAFIHWHHPFDIACDYNLPGRSSVYRHAHATGLFALRTRNLRFVLENLLERVDRVKLTAHAVVRAVRAYTRISDRGEWTEPPTRIIVSPGPPSLSHSPTLPASTEHVEQLALPARQAGGPARRGGGPAPRKARAKPRSNRHKGLQSR